MVTTLAMKNLTGFVKTPRNFRILRTISKENPSRPFLSSRFSMFRSIRAHSRATFFTIVADKGQNNGLKTEDRCKGFSTLSVINSRRFGRPQQREEIKHTIDQKTVGDGWENNLKEMKLREVEKTTIELSPSSPTGAMASIGFATMFGKIVSSGDFEKALKPGVYLVRICGQPRLSVAFMRRSEISNQRGSMEMELMREDGKPYKIVPLGLVSLEILGKIRDYIPGLCETEEDLRVQVINDMHKANQIKNVILDAIPI
mmetsp:Transcript_908/g.1176  ORF Transcript_908/g.1176 Transcript_908/m.1176 type:complete len:258 (+) Transcript_908:101-874(+)|eukprot:jgi/Bigna1/84332/fgenesh1_pg.130_\